MTVLAWMVLGLIVGFVASNITKSSGQGMLIDLVLGIVGAVAGGYLFAAVEVAGIAGFSLYRALVAIVGAVVVLCIYHGVSDRSV